MLGFSLYRHYPNEVFCLGRLSPWRNRICTQKAPNNCLLNEITGSFSFSNYWNMEETSVTSCHSSYPFSHFTFSSRASGFPRAHWRSARDHINQPYLWPCDHIWANGMWEEVMHSASGACLATGEWWSGVGSRILRPTHGSPILSRVEILSLGAWMHS